MMKRISGSYGFKVIILMVLILLMLIPISFVRSIISERSQRSRAAESEIMESWGSQFYISGPILRIPVLEKNEYRSRDDKGNEKTEISEHRFFLWLTPELLDSSSVFETETKKRGIFSVPLFSGTVDLGGNFSIARAREYLKPNQQLIPDQAELIISLSSQKGIRKINRGTLNNRPLDFRPGNRGFGVYSYSGGIYANADIAGEDEIEFDISLAIQGGKSFRILPLGKDTRVAVSADWPSPSFQGNYLPHSHTITENGFDAGWEVSYLSRNIPLCWNDNAKNEQPPELGEFLFGVNFFKALNHYALNERAVKYALLFIIVPFLTFFLLELILKKEIHPVQYLLAGIGNVVFYLLLLSFSEQLRFSSAYFIASLALTAMMVLYTRSLMGSWKKSWFMGVIMAASYLFLYFTLQSEDWALLIGSLAAFGITALVMFLTRKLDWYNRKTPDETVLVWPEGGGPEEPREGGTPT